MVTSQNQLENAFRDGSIPEGSDFKNLIDTIFSRLDQSTADTRYPTKTELSNNYARKTELTEELSDYTEYVTKNILPEYLQDNKYVDDKRLNTDLNNLRTQITSSILDTTTSLSGSIVGTLTGSYTSKTDLNTATASLKTDIESLLVNDSGGLIFGHEQDKDYGASGLIPFSTSSTVSLKLKYKKPYTWPVVRVFVDNGLGYYRLVSQVSAGSVGIENYTVIYGIDAQGITDITISLDKTLSSDKYFYLIN